MPSFLVKLLSISGYHPQLTSCAGCGAEGALGGFSAAFGGAVCDACWRQDRDADRLGADRLLLLRRMLTADFGVDAGDAAPELTNTLRRYAEYHLERRMKSVPMLVRTAP